MLVFLWGCNAPVPKVVPHKPPLALPAPPAVQPAPSVATPRVFDESILRGKEFLLEAASPPPPPARDRVLGTLGTNDEVLRAVSLLFHQAASGNLDEKLLVARWAAYLKTWAARVKAEGLEVEKIRLGIPVEDQQGTMIPVRILGKTKEYRGWVFLVRQDKDLLLSDVQLQASEPLATPFDPESPVQEISSPSRR